MRTRIAYIAIIIGIFGVFSCFGANLHWKNSGTDMLKAASYDENKVPTADDTIYFDEPMVTQPYLSADLTVKAIFFGRDNKVRTTTDTDPDGYIFTGAEGKKLTLTLSGGDQNYCIDAATTGGTAVFRIPIVFSAGTAAQRVAANGITLVFESPIATANSDHQQEIYLACEGANASHIGKIVLSAANPDFKPKRIYIYAHTYLELKHPDALINVSEFVTGSWASGEPYPHLINNTGKPFVWDALTKVTRNSHGLDNFFFEGDPFVLTNCTFAGSLRQQKSKTFNAEVALKRFASEDKDSDYQIFTKDGTNVLHLLEAPYEATGCTGHVKVVQGMIHVKQLDGIAYRPHRRFQLACRVSTMPATLAVDGDTNIRISDNNGISFYYINGDKNMCGFSALSGTARVRLCGPDGQYLPTVTSKTSCEGQTYWMMPEYPSFGHPKANGTVVFMNDYVGESGNNNSLYAMRGGAKVAVRFNGSYTIATDREFYKRHNGVAAFDGSFNISYKKSARVYNGGGILMNCDDHNGDWYLEKDGSWIGGKGGINAVEVKANSFIRPGEDGIGEFTLFGVNKNTTLLTTGGIFAEIGYDGGAGCIVCKGGSSSIGFTAEPGCRVLVDGEVNKFAPGKKRVKIIDWSQISDQVPSSKMSMFNIDNYTVEIVDSHKFKKAWLEKEEDEKAIYLVYVRPSEGFSMVFRP